MKRIICALLCLILLFPCLNFFPVRAEETEEITPAENILSHKTITDYSGFRSLTHLFDGDDHWGSPSNANCSLQIENDTGIGSLYTVFYRNQKYYTVTDNATGTVYTREDPFLHDFLDLEAVFGTIPTSVTITFGPDDLIINELYAFTPGQVPDFVQRWELPNKGDTDLLLFSAHGDDEHLFFAGILPYYAGELGYQVQVVYLTDHHNNVGPTRLREMLDGLWAVGIHTYPVFGTHPDFMQREITTTYMQYERNGITREDLIGFVMENIRRFKPKVVVTHDFNGEYGHGQHMVLADVVTAAVEISMDAAQHTESAEKYGVWDVPKTYIHLYKENPIIMDWDQPLEAFDGKTAFYVSIYIAFQKHKSQVADFESYYRNCSKATEIPKYSPIYYGLYRSTVGEDVEKNDFFENLTTHAEDAAIEEAQRLAAEEEARRQAEEEARLKAEEEARLASEEAARQESLAQEAASQSTEPGEPASSNISSLLVRFWYVPAILAVILIFGVILLCHRCHKKYF